MTSGSSRFPTHHIPDDGTRYTPSEIVRVDHSSGQVQIIKDLEGDYEVHELPAGHGVRRRSPTADGSASEGVRPHPAADPDPWAPRSPFDR